MAHLRMPLLPSVDDHLGTGAVPARLRLVLERQLQLDPVDQLTVITDLNVLLGHLGHPQVTHRPASLAASSHELVLVPITSITRYTLILSPLLAVAGLLDPRPVRAGVSAESKHSSWPDLVDFPRTGPTHHLAARARRGQSAPSGRLGWR